MTTSPKNGMVRYNEMREGVEMATKFETFNKATAQKIAVEKWNTRVHKAAKSEEKNTRFGVSTRVVKRTKGQFVTNVSAKQLIKG